MSERLLAVLAAQSDLRDQKFLFHYTPVQGISYLFIVLFGLAAIVHTYLGFKYRRRYLVWSAGVCGLMEVIGWIGRLLAAVDPDSSSLGPYLLKYVYLIEPFVLHGAHALFKLDVHLIRTHISSRRQLHVATRHYAASRCLLQSSQSTPLYVYIPAHVSAERILTRWP